MEDLKRDGWGRHTILVPGLVYWVTIPPALYLNATAAFAFLCPAFMAPVQHFCESSRGLDMVLVCPWVCGASKCAAWQTEAENECFRTAVGGALVFP